MRRLFGVGHGVFGEGDVGMLMVALVAGFEVPGFLLFGGGGLRAAAKTAGEDVHVDWVFEVGFHRMSGRWGWEMSERSGDVGVVEESLKNGRYSTFKATDTGTSISILLPAP